MGGRAATVTFLFTDLVGSTEVATAVGADDAERLRKRHFAILRRHVSAHGGHEVKSMGDGLMVTFASGSNAVDCAIAMQRAADRDNRERGDAGPNLRIGINTGDAVEEGGDYYGLPVVIAKRLCDVATAGQILTLPLVQLVAGSHCAHTFASVGSLELKGLATPVEALEVQWEPTPAVPLPLALDAADRRTFIGRDVERRRLDDAWSRAVDRERRVVLLGGEPGMGKTRLAVELARRVYSEGATVLFGRCDEEAPLPFQPFVEALGQISKAATSDELEAAAGSNQTMLARLVPEVADIVGVPTGRGDPETDRYRLFDAVTALIVMAAERAPTLLVVDDLQWAERPTLQLLLHVVRRLPTTRLAVVATYRDVEVDASHPLSATMVDLSREADAERLLLRGLSPDEVVALLEARAGHTLTSGGLALAAALHSETEGNPFFIDEVMRHLAESEAIFRRDGEWVSDAETIDDVGIPEGVRSVIGRRLGRLSDDANMVLAHASVFGREFTADVVEAISGLEGDRVLEALEQGLSARLVAEAPGFRPTFTFSHALIRQTLYDSISLSRRQWLHLKAAEALEGEVLERRYPPAAIAGHYRAAGATADPEKVVRWLVQAGAAAISVAAFEEARDHFEAAIELLDSSGVRDARLAQLLTYLSDLLYASGADFAKEVGSLERAVELYMELGDELRTAQARSRLGRSLSSFIGRQDIPRALEEFRRAEAVLEKRGDHPALGYVLIGVATASLAALRCKDAADAARSAKELAERLGNELLAANAAVLLGANLVPTGSLREGFELLEGAWQTAQRINSPTVGYLAMLFSAHYRTELFDPTSAREVTERELVLPYLAHSSRMLHMVRGYHGAAVGWAGDIRTAREMGAGLRDAGVRTIARSLGLWDGRWAEAFQDLRDAAAEVEAAGEMRFFATFSWTIGQWLPVVDGHADAWQLIQRALGVAQGEHKILEIKCRATAASLLVALGDAQRAWEHVASCREMLLRSTEDWRGLVGLVDRAEAVVIATRRDVTRAERLFASSADTFRRYSVPWEEAESLVAWGRACGDVSKFDAALQIYDRIGAGAAWSERALRLRASADEVASQLKAP